MYHKESLTWLDARDRCRETDGGDLASFTSQDAFDEALRLVDNVHAEIWIGLKEQWASIDGTPIAWEYWRMPLPQENCAYFTKYRKKWSEMDCKKSRHFMCERVGKALYF